ncbi:MAG: hypothetical protein ACI8XB_001035 [Patiriisocius sp.]|jgi:hypothetical protein
MKLRITLFAIFFTSILNAQVDSTSTDSISFNPEDFVTLSGGQLEDDSDGQGLSGLLYSGNDVFTSKATFQFRAARYNIRGLNNDHFTVMLNGVTMNDPELGFAIWANWGGLNDITRRPETRAGITSNDFSFSGVAGYSNIDLRASTKRKGLRYSQSLTNRSYRNRSMLTYNTGLMDNDVAISASVSGRWSEEGYVEGTSYKALSYFLSIEKKIDDKRSIGIVGLGTPSVTGRSGIVTQEAYDLKDDNYYNPYWGLQDGEKRNSRLRKTHKPIVMAWFDYKVNDKTKLTTNVFLQTGKYSQTRLNWYEGADPRGEYYRNLPSADFDPQNPDDAQALADFNISTSNWLNVEETGQVNWDYFYFGNGKNLDTIEDADGVAGNDVQGNRSISIVEENHSDPTYAGLNMNIGHEHSDVFSLDFGLNVSKYKSENYQTVNDLLGGEFWVNTNHFAARDFGIDSPQAQFDIETQNRIVGVDERYGYDYNIHITKSELFNKVEYKGDKIDLYGNAQVGSTTFWRDGQVKNGLYINDSKGESEKSSFIYGGLRGGAVYKISGRQFIEANGNYSSRAPRVRNSFISPRTRNQLADNLVNEKILAYDLSYVIRHPKMKARLSWFNVAVMDQSKVINVFIEGNVTGFGTLRQEGVDFLNSGLELGLERKLTQTITASAAFSKAQFVYNSRPEITFIVDTEGEPIFEDLTIYFENYKQGRMPQTVANLGLEYESPKFWRVGVDYNHFSDVWLDANPLRRTAEAVREANLNDLTPDLDNKLATLVDQIQLENKGTLNFNAGKSWKFDDKLLLLVLNANNVLNMQDFATGFEQIRFDFDRFASDSDNPEKFPARLGFMYGTTYFLMLRLDF